MYEYDCFISHASEDKDTFVRSLAQQLQLRQYRVWYDELSLSLGDSLSRSIDQGLSSSQYGIVVLSHSFFQKEWPQRELNGLVAREIEGKKVILPVWHKVSKQDVVKYSPILADKLAVSTEKGLDHVINKIIQVLDLATPVELKSERGVDYTQLQKLLEQQKWKEADQETVTVMLRCAGRESQGWLWENDIDNFPCEDLRTINQLWLHYSDGKFGFSVQKEIYESLGGTREYDEEVWKNFGDRVGWRKGGNWLYYSNLTFDIRLAPSAHLPGCVGMGMGMGEHLSLFSLFSRAKTCNL